jgi:hypothetical protein
MEGESGKSNRVVMPHCTPMLMGKWPVTPVDLAQYFFPENGREPGRDMVRVSLERT